MRLHNTLAIATIATSLLALTVAVANSGGPSPGPELDVPCDVDAGTDLEGVGSGCSAPITVTATLNGNHLSGSPDISGLGGVNAFSFPVPSTATGSILVTVEDANGRTTQKYVDIL